MSDCDGYTAAAILINYLNRLFPHYTQTKLTYRVHEGKQHGLIFETIPEGTKLVIAPDSSSSDYTIHQQLAEKGVDVLVLDHHEAEYESPYACVINNQLCDYPNKTLSGAGVVYKFCCFIDSLLEADVAQDFVDLATVGIMADVMMLTDLETRAIIQQGMDNGMKNPLLKTIVDKDDFHFGGRDLTPFNITWYISPFINGICRSGSVEEKRLVFDSMIEYQAYELIPSTKRGCKGQQETRVEQAARTCTNVKNRQTKSKEISAESINSILANYDFENNKVVAIKVDPKSPIDKNLTGLIANGLLEKYHRPIMILNQVKEKDAETGAEKIFWRGSARGYDNLGSFRELLLESGMVEYAQGHANAFGASIPDEYFNDLVRHINKQYADFNCVPTYYVDFIWQNKQIDPQTIIELADAAQLWGKGVEAPQIALEGIKIFGNQVNLYGLDKGKPTLSIKFDEGFSLVKFKSSEDEYNNLNSELGYVIANIVGKCANTPYGPQIEIQDYEIIGKQDYYF